MKCGVSFKSWVYSVNTSDRFRKGNICAIEEWPRITRQVARVT